MPNDPGHLREYLFLKSVDGTPQTKETTQSILFCFSFVFTLNDAIPISSVPGCFFLSNDVEEIPMIIRDVPVTDGYC